MSPLSAKRTKFITRVSTTSGNSRLKAKWLDTILAVKVNYKALGPATNVPHLIPSNFWNPPESWKHEL